MSTRAPASPPGLRPSLLRSSALPAALAALTALAAPGLARADEVSTRSGGAPLVGDVQQGEDGLTLRTSDGWTVRLPYEEVLARRDGKGRVSVPLADRLEDHALSHEGRGELREAYEAYAQAARFTLDACEHGALPPAEGALRLEVYLRRLQFFAAKVGRARDALELCLAAAEAAPSVLTGYGRDVAKGYAAGYLRALGEPAAARRLEQELGVVDAYFVALSFDNERGTGFETPYGPETEPFDPNGTFQGKTLPVGWRPQPVAAPPGGYIDLDALARPNDQALGYAVTYLFAEEAAPVALRLGSDESVKVWVNRTLVHERKLRRPYHADQDHVGVQLQAGWNELLLKVADETGSWGFSLRVTDPEGGPAAGVRAATLPEIASKPDFEPGTTPVTVAQGALDHLERRVRAEHKTGAFAADASWRDLFWLGYLHFAYQTHDRTEHPDRDALAAAILRQPAASFLYVFLSHSSGGAGEYSVNKEPNARRQALEEALRRDPQQHEARWLLASYYLNELGNAEKAVEVLRPTLEAQPSYLDAQLLMLQIDEQRDLDALASGRLRALMDAALTEIQTEQSVHYPRELLGRALDEARGRGDARRTQELYEALLETDRSNASALEGLADTFEAAGRADVAEQLYRQAIRCAPFRLDLRLSLGALLQAAGRLDDAATVLREAQELVPDAHEVATARGHLEERRGNDEQATALFQQALTLEPTLVDLQKYLEYRQRNEKREAPFEDAWTVDAEPLVAAARELALDPRQTHRYLLQQRVAKLHPDGTTSQFVQEVIRIENVQGARGLASYGAYYQTDQRLEVQRARVFRQAGGIEEVPVGASRGQRAGEFTSGRQYTVRFPSLEPGDAIEVRYRVDDLERGFFGDYYGHVAYFQAQQPLDWVRYVLIAPAGRQLYFHTPGAEGVTRREAEDEATKTQVHVFEKKGVAPLESEPHMPWAKEVLAQVQVSTFKDWDAFARWYWNLVASQHEADEGIRAKVQELVKGAETDEEKIRRIYHFVVSEIRYNAAWEFGIHGFKPYNATKIYARKFGDCKDKSTLINTMLREVGIRSFPVLIFGQDARGREDLTLPLMSHFNHCISWVDEGQGGIFLDGTAEHHSYPNLPSMDYGARVVIVTPKGGLIKEIPYRAPEANAVREEHVVKLQPGGGATIFSKQSGTGTFEVVLRSWLQREGRRKELLEPRIGAEFTGAEVKSVETSDLGDLEQPVEVTMEVAVPKLLTPTVDGGLALQPVRSWLFDLIYSRGQRLPSFAADDQRTYDLVLPVPSAVEETIRYELPEGLSVKSLPAPVRLESDLGHYELIYTQEGRHIVLRRVLRIPTHRVPVTRYTEFRRFVREVDRAESERPILSKGAAQQ